MNRKTAIYVLRAYVEANDFQTMECMGATIEKLVSCIFEPDEDDDWYYRQVVAATKGDLGAAMRLYDAVFGAEEKARVSLSHTNAGVLPSATICVEPYNRAGIDGERRAGSLSAVFLSAILRVMYVASEENAGA